MTTSPKIDRVDVRASGRRVPWWVWALAIVFVLVIVIAAFGGFGVVPVQKVTLVEPGDVVAGVEIDLSVDRVFTSDRMPGARDPIDGEEVLIVETRLENRTSTPSTMIQERIRLIAGDVVGLDDDPDRVVEVRNADAVDFLQPGLVTTLDFVWSVEEGSLADGDEIVVGILDRTPVSDDPIYGDTAYTAPRPIARLVVDLDGED